MDIQGYKNDGADFCRILLLEKQPFHHQQMPVQGTAP